MQRVLCLDGWRGGAILMVLFGHFVTARGINLGRFGVEFFFVLSGRLMAEILFIKSEALSGFYWRRISRIYPALLCFVLSVLAVAVVRNHGDRWQGYLSALTLTYNYYQLWSGHVDFVDHVWSLCVEEHAYVLLGLIALVWRNNRFGVAILIGLLAVIGCADGLISTLMGESYTEVYWRSDVRGASILFGASAYLVLQDRREWLILVGRLSLPLVVFGGLLNLQIFPDPVKYSIGTVCIALAVVAVGDCKNSFSGFLKMPSLIGFGLCSYSIYLWQQPFYIMHEKFPPWAGFVLMVPAILMGIASFFVIERPARTYLNSCLYDYHNRRATTAS